MARDLRLLPGREIGIEIGKRLPGLGFEPRQFLANGNGIALRREHAQLQNLGFEFGNRFFKVEIGAHCHRDVFAEGDRPNPFCRFANFGDFARCPTPIVFHNFRLERV